MLEVWAGVALLVCLDIYLRARRRTGERWPPRAAWGEVRRERWTAKRLLIVAAAIVAFYVTYLAYRNLKASIPLLRPGDLFDAQLADLERAVFFGTDPAALLHDLLGTGIAAHALSVFYVAFIVFLPLSLGLVLVFAERLQVGLFFATALSINWILGIATYFILPALGPIYYDPGLFSALPYTEVSRLQDLLHGRPGRLPRGPEHRDPAGDRGVRLPARRDELHRAARRLHAEARPGRGSGSSGPGWSSPSSRRSTWAGTTSSTTSPASRWAPWRSCWRGSSPASTRARASRRRPARAAPSRTEV